MESDGAVVVLTVDDRDVEVRLNNGAEVEATGCRLVGVAEDNVGDIIVVAAQVAQPSTWGGACVHCSGN